MDNNYASKDCLHMVNNWAKVGRYYYPFCNLCEMVVEVEEPEASSNGDVPDQQGATMPKPPKWRR